MRSEALSSHRFVPDENSLEVLHKCREIFERFRQKSPVLRGVGFFGSYLMGTQNKNSDLDITFFYNSAIENATQDYLDIASIKKAFNLGVKLSQYYTHPLEFSVNTLYTIDLNPINIKANLNYIASKDRDRGSSYKQESDQRLSDAISQILPLFFLCLGKDVYQTRSLILEELSAKKKGDEIFLYIMDQLRIFERESSNKHSYPTYEGYPNNINGAKEYFLTSELVDNDFPTDVVSFIKTHNSLINFKRAIRRVKNTIDSVIRI